MATLLSESGAKFIGRNEGFEKRAYKDSGGVITIGHGFTWGSKVFRDYWNKQHGRRLQMGDTIALTESLTLLRQVVNEEYGKAADRALHDDVSENKFDAATDYLYNCGTGAAKDKWFQALAAGRTVEAAQLIRTSRVTAGGRRLPGLINRRVAEAKLISTGDYGPGITPSPVLPPGSPPIAPKPIPKPTASDEVMWVQQQLANLKLYSGDVDGMGGPLTDGAIKNFQRQHPELTVDGIVGPATRAALIRAVDVKRAKGSAAAAGTVGVVGGGGAATTTDQAAALPWHTIEWLVGLGLVGLIIAGVAFLVWRNRGRIFGFRSPT